MTPSKTIAILLRLTADWRREELQLCKQFGDVIIPQSMRERRIKETKAIDAAVEMINRLEAAERDVALTERVIDTLGSELNAVAKERDELRAKIEAMEKQEPVAQVGVHKTGGNAGIAWSARPLNEFDSLPPLRDGDRLYLAPGAKVE